MVSRQPQPRGNDSEEWLSSILSTSPEWTPREPEVLADPGQARQVLKENTTRLRDPVPPRPRRSRSAAQYVPLEREKKPRGFAHLSPRWHGCIEGSPLAGMCTDEVMAELGARIVAQDEELRRRERLIRRLHRKTYAEKENVETPFCQDGIAHQTEKEGRWKRGVSPPPVERHPSRPSLASGRGVSPPALERRPSRTSLPGSKEVDLKLRRAEIRFERRLRRRAEKMASVAWRQSAMFGAVAALFGLGCVTLVLTLMTR